MVEHSIRIRGVGGSIPPVSTSFFCTRSIRIRGGLLDPLFFFRRHIFLILLFCRRQLTFLLKKMRFPTRFPYKKTHRFSKQVKKLHKCARTKSTREGSGRASCCFIIGVWETPPVMRRVVFFFFINGFRARGELNSWKLLLPHVEEKTTREDGSTTNNNSRAGKEW